MSKKTVLDFIQQVILNPTLHDRVQTAGDFANLQQIASSEGYPFSEQEWNITSAEAFNGLLSDQDLEDISAGLTASPATQKSLMGFMGGGMFNQGQALIKFVPKLEP